MKSKLEHLLCNFPKLTEKNQFYLLGLVEGLRYTQDKKFREKCADASVKTVINKNN